MASLYERPRGDRRAARLGLDEDPAALGPQPGVTVPDEGLVSDALQAQLNTPPPAAVPRVTRDAVADRSYNQSPRTVTRSPGTVQTPGQAGPRVTTPGVTAGADDVDTGVDTGGAETDTGVPDNTQDWRDSISQGNAGTMIGFRMDDYEGDVKARTSVKNTFKRIASRYKNAPSMVDAVLADPDFRRAFPNASKVEGGANDKIDFGGVLSDFDTGTPVGIVDVLKASDPTTDTAEGWTWLPEDEAGGVDAALDGGGGMSVPSIDGLGESDVLAQIMAQIDALAEGRNPLEADAINRMLQGGA